MRDRVTRNVALISVNQLDNANKIWGIDYPICGDTLKAMRIDRLVGIKVNPLTKQDRRIIDVMNRRLKEWEGLQ